MAKKILDELDICGWEIRKKPGRQCRLSLSSRPKVRAPGPVN
jgi:hypothetical protein